ncbi:hypothetical protein DL93DRAFT_2080444 [Clavulina sp. PMI_390]|nr:hypothetical protein DL93DRAFT_2080444 [Clavulina sp. PMI_390]
MAAPRSLMVRPHPGSFFTSPFLINIEIAGGSLWTNSWWSYGDVPGGSAGVWVKDASC